MPETPDKKSPQDLLDWLGISDAPNWAVAQWLARGFAASLFLLFALSYAAAFGIAGKVVFGGGEVTLGAGGLIAALLGAPFLIWGTILKHQTVRTQQEGHMTDRIAKAVEMLGTEKTDLRHEADDAGNLLRDKDGRLFAVERTLANLEVRIGAILSLERIAQDSTTFDKGRDHVRVMEILCTYIRENAPNSKPRETPRADIETALQVLARRTVQQRQIEFEWRNQENTQTDSPYMRSNIPTEKAGYLPWLQRIDRNLGYRLNLSSANLSGLFVKDGDFSNALFNGTIFSRCTFTDTNFIGANFYRSDFKGAKFFACNLDACRISNTDLSGSSFYSGSINYATLTKVELDNQTILLTSLRFTSIENSDLSKYSLTMEPISESFGDSSVRLGLLKDQPIHWPRWKLGASSPLRFQEEVHKWRENPDSYVRAPPPNGD